MPSTFTQLPRPQKIRQRATLLLLGLLLFCPLVAVGGEFTVKTPEGALFDSRTHYYDAERKRVFKRSEFVGLHGEEKRLAYASVGMQSGPRDPERWKETREAWKQELDARQHRRFLIAQEKANRRRGVTPKDDSTYYAWITLNDGTRILLMRRPGATNGSTATTPVVQPPVRRPGSA